MSSNGIERLRKALGGLPAGHYLQHADPEALAEYTIVIRSVFETIKQAVHVLSGALILLRGQGALLQAREISASLVHTSSSLGEASDRVSTIRPPRAMKEHYNKTRNTVEQLLAVFEGVDLANDIVYLKQAQIEHLERRVHSAYRMLREIACEPLGLVMVDLHSGCAGRAH